MAITYPTTLDTLTDKIDNVDDVQAVDINDVQDICEALEAKVGIDSSTVITSLDYKVNTFLFNRKIWIYEDAAPSGWNIVASTTDALLACKGGANAYNTTGGQQIGTWTQPNHTHTGPSHTHTGPSHTHTGPSHTHSVPRDGWGIQSGHVTGRIATDNAAAGWADNNAANDTTSGASGTGATAASGTGATGVGGTGATGNGATAATYRPLANLGIIIEKT